MTMTYSYERDGAAIYRESFATIRSEADLAGLSEAEARVAVRIIHACGMVEITRDLVFSPGFAEAARGGCHTVEAIGVALKAGTNCGSCRAEIRGLIEANRLEAAE